MTLFKPESKLFPTVLTVPMLRLLAARSTVLEACKEHC